jgi:hypothetical protein
VVRCWVATPHTTQSLRREKKNLQEVYEKRPGGRMPGWEKAARSSLVKHMFWMHGKFTMPPGTDRLTLEQLERIHDIMHRDGYMCPPHKHKDGEVKLKYGEDYLHNLVEAVRG